MDELGGRGRREREEREEREEERDTGRGDVDQAEGRVRPRDERSTEDRARSAVQRDASIGKEGRGREEETKKQQLF